MLFASVYNFLSDVTTQHKNGKHAETWWLFLSVVQQELKNKISEKQKRKAFILIKKEEACILSSFNINERTFIFMASLNINNYHCCCCLRLERILNALFIEWV